MKTLTVYCGIVNLHTGQEIEFNGEVGSLKRVVTALGKLPGTKYGTDWKYSGDCLAAEGNICVDGANSQYHGRAAVRKFLRDYPAATQTRATESVTQQVTFGKGDVRSMRFIATPRQVAVRCKGLPRMVVRSHAASTRKSDAFEACINVDGQELYVVAQTQERAYKKAVRQLWAV